MTPYVVPKSEWEGWHCAECGIPVKETLVQYADGRFRYEPISKYWNVKKEVVYCSPTCSTEGHKQ